MARLWIMSDLHLEVGGTPFRPRPFQPDAVLDHDVVVLAGDIAADPATAATWAEFSFSKPVVLVAGNHEFYHADVSRRIAETDTTFTPSVHFLENASVEIAGARFLGCTLWTDFELHGSDRTAVAYAMRDAFRGVPDFETIRAFTPADARARHLASRAWLEAELAKPFDGPTVVVTHHAPSGRSIGPTWQGATTSPAYASDLEALIERWQPTLWIHGHVHDPSDYLIGRTRVVCNPRGFSSEAPGFDPAMVIEV